MALPLLRFIAYRDYYVVRVENLAQLSVPQIQQIEAFAEERRSRLDFSNASMRIWKRIDFAHFNKTLALAGIMADTIESEVVPQKRAQETPVQENPSIGFGKYKGMRYSELPEPYLLWLKGNYNGPERSAIESELRRRSL